MWHNPSAAECQHNHKPSPLVRLARMEGAQDVDSPLLSSNSTPWRAMKRSCPALSAATHSASGCRDPANRRPRVTSHSQAAVDCRGCTSAMPGFALWHHLCSTCESLLGNQVQDTLQNSIAGAANLHENIHEAAWMDATSMAGQGRHAVPTMHCRWQAPLLTTTSGGRSPHRRE